jgi:hypothetical protein
VLVKRFRIYGIVINPRFIDIRIVKIDSGIHVLPRMVAVMLR